MKKSLYGVLFPKKVDERIDIGSVITIENDTEYVVLGFEVCDCYCNAVVVTRDHYLQANPLLHECIVGLEKLSFVEQLDKKEALAYYMKLRLTELDIVLETRENIKEQSEDVYCKLRFGIDMTFFDESDGSFILLGMAILLILLIGSLLTKKFLLLFVVVLGIIALSIVICGGGMEWEQIKK